MNILTYIKYVALLWDLCVTIVKQVEATIPDGGAGSAKLAAFDVILKGLVDKSEDISESFESIQPVAHDIVAAIVKLLNATNGFRK